MPRASVETCLGDVINGMIASGQFFFLMNEVYHDVYLATHYGSIPFITQTNFNVTKI